MWRSTLITLLMLMVLEDTHALVTHGNASVTMIGNNYYIVSKNRSHVSIRSDAFSPKLCDLELNDVHVGKIQVAGIEDKILLLYRQNSKAFKLVQLDPSLCLYHPLHILETSAEATLEPQLIIVNNSLDVFLRGHENCLPCRFDVNGNRFEVSGQLVQGNSTLLKSIIVQEFIPKGQIRNYAFVANFADGTSLLKIIDNNFGTTKEIYFDHRIEALAANSGPSQSLIGITYAGLGNPYERVLALYTNTLDLVFETRVIPDPRYKIYNTLLSINSTGHSFLQYVEESPSSVNLRRFYYAVYNSKGVITANKNLTYFSLRIKYDWQLFLHEGVFRSVIHKYEAAGTDTIVWYYH